MDFASTMRRALPFSSKVQVDRLDAGLKSVQGAQEIISIISSRRFVNKLVLGHNELGDDGCIALFKFLGSVAAKRHRINEISLNSNGIGNKGLLAISEYLFGNEALKELFLQNNNFTGDPSVVTSFTNAINSSRLELLSLTTNRQLSDDFADIFLPALNAPHLREIHISAMGFTKRSASHIVDYISSPQRCRLHTFKCNGNSLGFHAIRSIIRAIERKNYALLTVELYANQILESRDLSSTDNATEEDQGSTNDNDGFDSSHIWKVCEKRLGHLLLRNAHLKREVEPQALTLLRYSRIFLLCPSRKSAFRRLSNENPSSSSPNLCMISDLQNQIPGARSFAKLPTELKLYILSFLVPSLSPAQRIRVYNYASDITTLPSLLPDLSNPVDTGNSTLLYGPFPRSRSHVFNKAGHVNTLKGNGSTGLADTFTSWKTRERAKWLDYVGCSSYEPEGMETTRPGLLFCR